MRFLHANMFSELYYVQLQLIGYARKHEKGGWTFSTEALDILKQFIKKFPVMFGYIRGNPTEDVYYEEDLFPKKDG